MILHQPTPFARRQLTEQNRLAIATAQPTDYRVMIGQGMAGWTCRILTPDLRVAAEVYGLTTAGGAWRAALAELRKVPA